MSIPKETERKPLLLGLTPNKLLDVTTALAMPRFAARQIAEWIYKRRACGFVQMTNLAKKHREALSASYDIGFCAPVSSQTSSDGVIKYLFEVDGGHRVETVYIPDKDRNTLCVSSQVGCGLGCHFCMTGRQGLQRNLTVPEILNQILAIPGSEELTNVVFMGMGEPLSNLEAVLAACDVLSSDWGLEWSPRRITISTSGLMRHMPQLVEGSSYHVAVSLHNPFPLERAQLMPVERVSPISDVLAYLRRHDWSGQRRLSFEYTMFDGVNDTDRHLEALVRLLKGLFCRVNLIRYHVVPGVALRPSPDERITRFRDRLNEKGIIATVRRSRGQDIDAACGMLSSKRDNDLAF